MAKKVKGERMPAQPCKPMMPPKMVPMRRGKS